MLLLLALSCPCWASSESILQTVSESIIKAASESNIEMYEPDLSSYIHPCDHIGDDVCLTVYPNKQVDSLAIYQPVISPAGEQYMVCVGDGWIAFWRVGDRGKGER